MNAVSADTVAGTQSPWTPTPDEDAKGTAAAVTGTAPAPGPAAAEPDPWTRSQHLRLARPHPQHGPQHQHQHQYHQHQYTQTQTQTDPEQVVHPSMVADKYLLLELLDGSSLCRCVHVKSQQEFVCKVLYFVLSSVLVPYSDKFPMYYPIICNGKR